MKERMSYYRARVYRFLVQFTKNEDLAEDLTQDVMFKVWSRRNQLQNLEDLDNYILKMAKHHVIDHFKKMAREKAYQEEMWYRLQQSTLLVLNPLVSAEIVKELDAVVLTLPPRQQEIYTLNQRNGLSLDEIATTLDIAPRTARNHLNRAMKAIRSKLGPEIFLGWMLVLGWVVGSI